MAWRFGGGVAIMEISRRPDHRHIQGARNRRRGQRQQIQFMAEFFEMFLLGDAKTVFLINDHQSQALILHILGQ